MPSISSAKLQEIEEARDTALVNAERHRKEADSLRSKVGAFDGILDKIERAAQGRPLTDSRDGGYFGHVGMAYGNEPSRLTDAERHDIEVASLRERVVDLERRLAATVAVAQFAKAHKA